MRTSTSIVMVACALCAVWGTGCGGDSSSADLGPDGMTGGDMGPRDMSTTDTGTDAGDVDAGTDAGDTDAGSDAGSDAGGDAGPTDCGNGVLDTGETCDTGIDPADPDGCPISCNDGDPCTMDVTAGSACTTVCTHTALTASGTTADTCGPAGATMAPDVDCGTPPSAFRVTAARLISPRVVQNILGCSDLTDTGIGGGLVPSLNSALMDQITGSTGGTYDLSIVSVFRPLVPADTATTPLDVVMNASCTTASPPVCSLPATGGAAVSTTANNMTAGTCLAPLDSEVNGSCPVGTMPCDATYDPGADTVSGPCFVSDETDIVLAFTVAGTTLRITLHHARVAATYSGTPVDTLVPGIMTGFLSEQEAADVMLSVPSPLGTIDRRLYELLQANGASVFASDGTEVFSSCNNGGGRVEDDRDTLADGTVGFKFFLNVTLDLATWSSP